MTACERSDILFDAMLKAAIAEAFERDIDALPKSDALEAYEPSPDLDKRIGSLIKKSYWRIKAKRLTRGLGKAAACLCILLTITSAVLMSVGATRNAIFNAIIKWHEKYTEIRFGESSENMSFYRPTYLPEGFSEKTVEAGVNFTTIIYRNSSGERIAFDQQSADGGVNLVDSENTEYTEVLLMGNTGYLFKAKTENDSNILIWEQNGIVLELVSTIESEELLRIAESVKK